MEQELSSCHAEYDIATKRHLNLFGVQSIFMESVGAVVMKIRLRLKDIEKIESSKNGIFCKKKL